jgi:hypothetical protein
LVNDVASPDALKRWNQQPVDGAEELLKVKRLFKK